MRVYSAKWQSIDKVHMYARRSGSGARATWTALVRCSASQHSGCHARRWCSPGLAEARQMRSSRYVSFATASCRDKTRSSLARLRSAGRFFKGARRDVGDTR